MSENTLVWLLCAAMAVAWGASQLASAPARRRLRQRDQQEDAGRLALCEARGWIFRRDDRRHPEDRFRIWEVSGAWRPGREWTATFRLGSELATDSENRTHLDFRCAGAGRGTPRFVFSTRPTLESLAGGWQRGLSALGVAAQGFAGNAKRAHAFHGDAPVVPVRAPRGYAWAAAPPELADALARDEVLGGALAGLVAVTLPEAQPPTSGVTGYRLYLMLDEHGLSFVMPTPLFSAEALRYLLDAASRALEIADAWGGGVRKGALK